ncbi:N-acetyllactosaminide 3-alpha-galactosyltransferase [Cooperia oncophora]
MELLDPYSSTHSEGATDIPQCSLSSDHFVGRINVSFEEIPLEQLEEMYNYLEPGGHNIPDDCRAANRIAVIVPYRDRQSHLRILLNNMHRFLTKQKLDYSIIVVEQIENQTFNRAKLLNVGFMEANKIYKWQCYLFHDVDLLPEDDRNLHTCPTNNPRHMAVAVNKFDYKDVWHELGTYVGSVQEERMDFQIDTGDGVAKMTTCIREEASALIDSNEQKALTKPPSILYIIIRKFNNRTTQFRIEFAGYKLLLLFRCRHKLLEHTKKDWRSDGLNTLNYKVVNITFENLFTHIVVDLLEATERPPLEKLFCH